MTFTDMTEEEADERETDCDCRSQSERRHSLWKVVDYEKLSPQFIENTALIR